MLIKLWNWVKGAVKSIVETVAEAVVARAKEIAKDKDLINLALNAVMAAAKDGLTGDDAWVKARDQFTDALKKAGYELGNCAIDTTLQCVYAAWKDGKK